MPREGQVRPLRQPCGGRARDGDRPGAQPPVGERSALARRTGGGLPGNLPRVLPAAHRAVLRRGSWPVPGIFERIRKAGNVAEPEMLRTFNMGIGMCAVVPRADAARTVELLAKKGQSAFEIGAIESAPGLGTSSGFQGVAAVPGTTTYWAVGSYVRSGAPRTLVEFRC